MIVFTVTTAGQTLINEAVIGVSPVLIDSIVLYDNGTPEKTITLFSGSVVNDQSGAGSCCKICFEDLSSSAYTITSISLKSGSVEVAVSETISITKQANIGKRIEISCVFEGAQKCALPTYEISLPMATTFREGLVRFASDNELHKDFTVYSSTTVDHFLNDYVTLSTEQGIAADKIILGNKKLYLSPTKKAYLGDNNITLIDGQLSFSKSETANTESILMASVLQDNSLEINGNLLPQPYGSTVNSNYSLGATNATFKEGYIRTLYGNVGDASNSYNVYASNLYFGSYTDDTGVSVSTNMHLWNNAKGGIDVTGNMNPASTNRYNLGSTTYKWKEVNAVSFNGNATSATKLNSSVNIDGKSFDGSASITHYVRCDSPGADTSKVVDCPGFTLEDGARLSVYFANANSATNPTLKIRTSTSPETFLPEKVISIYGTNGMDQQAYNTWRGGSIVGLVYDATSQYWIWEGYMRYTYRSNSASYDTAGQSITGTYIKTVDLVNYAGTVIDSGSSSSGSDCTWGAGAITASKYPTHIRFTKGNGSTRTYISIAALVASSLIGFSRSSSSGSLSPYGAIGSVAILMVQRTSNSTTIDRGTIIDSSSTLVARGIVANSNSGDLSWSSGASGTVSGTWVALNYTGTSSSGYNYCMVLAIRIL